MRPLTLIVDPHEDIRRLHVAILRPLGLEFEEADDGAVALARAIARTPALVITEARLPRVDGYALCSLLRAEPTTRSTRILVVTTSVLPSDLERARLAGADDVVEKASTPERLCETVRALISRAREVRDRPAGALQCSPAQTLRSAPPATKRRMMSRTHQREITLTPPEAPPELRCPDCDHPLTYEFSFVGGVSARFPEQWDTFTCVTCGSLEYRHRTRTLRHL